MRAEKGQGSRRSERARAVKPDGAANLQIWRPEFFPIVEGFKDAVRELWGAIPDDYFSSAATTDGIVVKLRMWGAVDPAPVPSGRPTVNLDDLRDLPNVAKVSMLGKGNQIEFILDLPVGESKGSGYTDDIMGDGAHDLNALAADLGYTFESAKLILERGAKPTAGETTGRATAKPHLKWETNRRANEDPAHFAARAYPVEMQAGTLHRGVIGKEDPALRTKLNNWERTHPWPEKWPADVPYIPTQPEWNTERLAKLGRPPKAPKRPRIASEEGRLYDAARYRAAAKP
jgi:hypothetical protein